MHKTRTDTPVKTEESEKWRPLSIKLPITTNKKASDPKKRNRGLCCLLNAIKNMLINTKNWAIRNKFPTSRFEMPAFAKANMDESDKNAITSNTLRRLTSGD
jgi:hypothetical protein